MTTAIATTTTADVGVNKWELVKKTVCPPGISDAEFLLFQEQCKRSGLDPLKKQIFCVERKAKVGDEWVKKYDAQPAEAGMLARAEMFADYRGITAEAVYTDDDCMVDAGAGVVVHRFKPAGRGKLLGAWACVRREGRTPVVRFLKLEDYIQKGRDGNPLSMWGRIPETMIVKCARVAVLRVVFPEAFGGLYIPEELPPAQEEPTPDVSQAYMSFMVDIDAAETVDRMEELRLLIKSAGLVGPAYDDVVKQWKLKSGQLRKSQVGAAKSAESPQSGASSEVVSTGSSIPLA